MSLTWKDGVTTTLAASTAALAYIKYQGWYGWLNAPRLSTLILALIGIGMCMQGSAVTDSSFWTGLLGSLGVLALIVAVIGLIVGQQWPFYVLAGDIILLWLLSTIRHALG